MPELPEVETIRRGLQQKIVGLTIQKVDVLAPKSLVGDVNLVYGQSVLSIERKAKILLINLTSNISLLIHLKMSGQVILVSQTVNKSRDQNRFIGGHPTKDMLLNLPNKSTRIIFYLSDGSTLFFNDQRRFGWVKVVNSEELKVMNQIGGMLYKLGPEPLEKSFSWQQLKTNLFKHKSMPIKVALLDQTIVSGIGNIYASEACFNAGVNPQRKVSSLTDQEIKKIHLGIIKALNDGVRLGGSTRTHFVDAEGKKGLFLDYAKVYNRDKKPCLVCGVEIKKIKLGGRGTFYCPNCQK
jgi:formamidopyrimidine-DNA glycosylase